MREDELKQVAAAGGQRVSACNPYWDRFGITFRDSDGHFLVLPHRTWEQE